MSEIETPDDEGGIDADTNVSFIVIAAKKGIQAAAVTICDPPEPKVETQKENVAPIESSFADLGLSATTDTGAVDLDDPNAW